MTAHETSMPRAARWVLERVAARRLGAAYVGDLLELYERRAARDGMARARRWLWRELAVAALRMPSRIAAAPSPPHGDAPLMAFRTELRLAARRLAHAPSFTTLCTLTLALGIGAVTALFAVVNPVLLRPLPYPSPDRIVLVNERSSDGTPSNVGYATFDDITRASRSIVRAAAIGSWMPTLSGRDDAERVTGERVSWTYFRLLGVQPVVGRDFVAAEDAPGQQRVVLLTHALWTRRYGADRTLVGRTIDIDDVPHLVAGVLPAGFENVMKPDAQIFRVLGYAPELSYACRTCRHLRMIARLRPDVTREAAAAELTRLSAAIVRDHPKEYATSGMFVTSLADQATRDVRPTLSAMLGAVLLVLLLAAANVANLQLGRAVRRDGEFAIRAALGAGRAHLVRQLLAEGALLAGIGATVGVALAAVALKLLRVQLPSTFPHVDRIALDAPALAVAALVTASLAAVVGLAPLAGASARSRVDALRTGTRLLTPGRHLARALLVSAEVALALTLLAGAGLLTRSLVRLTNVDAGFDAAGLLTMETQASGARYPDAGAVYAQHDAVRAAVAAIPGVTGVAITSQLPLGGNVDQYGVRAQDRPLPNPELAPGSDRYTVSPDFLRVMRIPIVRGRAFVDADDRAEAAPVVVVSEALASTMWRGEDPIGKRIQMGDTARPWRTVVGVARNVRHSGLDATVTQQVYVPTRQWYFADDQVTLVVRTSGDPAAIANAVRNTVRALDPSQPIGRVATMRDVVALTTAQRRLAQTLFLAFSAIALVLAAAGIYGVLAGHVAERTREIGLRRALGALPASVVRSVVGQGARLAGPGLVVGLAGAVALGRVLRGLLYGVSETDPLTLGGVAATLAVVALVACLAPALRAVRIGPMSALRDG